MSPYTYNQIAQTINHSLVKPQLSHAEIVAGCALARAYRVLSVSVKPCYVPLAVKCLSGGGIAVGGIVGFPHGSHTTAIKAAEAHEALANGAAELDMVINLGELRSGHDDFVCADIGAVAEVCRGRAVLKVIIETAYLNRDEKVRACQLAERAGADIVKTSSGFAAHGATPEDVRLMREVLSSRVGVKAAGGIRTLDDLLALLEAGAMQVGTSSTAAILDEARRRFPAV
jgi:deoxyribose-phosphate aldolase